VKKQADSSKIADIAIEAIQEKKGNDIVKIDLREVGKSISDFFIICHADSTMQVSTIAEYVEKHLRKSIKEHVWHKEGTENNQWVLLDYVDVVVHVFQSEYRSFYDLENLWSDAKIARIEYSY